MKRTVKRGGGWNLTSDKPDVASKPWPVGAETIGEVVGGLHGRWSNWARVAGVLARWADRPDMTIGRRPDGRASRAVQFPGVLWISGYEPPGTLEECYWARWATPRSDNRTSDVWSDGTQDIVDDLSLQIDISLFTGARDANDKAFQRHDPQPKVGEDCNHYSWGQGS